MKQHARSSVQRLVRLPAGRSVVLLGLPAIMLLGEITVVYP